MSAVVRTLGSLGLVVALTACGGGSEGEELPGPSAGVPAVNTGGPEATVGRLEVLTVFRGEWSHDFGELDADGTAAHVFSFGWDGQEDLVPKTLRPDCGCLSATLLSGDAEGRVVPHPMGRPLPARSPFGVRVELDTGGLSGKLKKTVRVISEDGDSLRLVLRATVRGGG